MERIIQLTTDYVTMKEAASYLQVTKQTVRQWIKEGKLTACRLSYRTVRVSSASIEKMLGRSQAIQTLRKK